MIKSIMKNVYFEGIVVTGVFLFFLCVAYRGIKQDVIALTVTALIIFWYFWETRNMRKEMINQTEIPIIPVLGFHLDKYESSFFLENFGNFPTFNIKVQNMEIRSALKNATTVLRFVFEPVVAVLPREKMPIKCRLLKDGREIDDINLFFAHFIPEYAKFDFQTLVTFENVLGQEYEVALKCGKSGIGIGRPKRK